MKVSAALTLGLVLLLWLALVLALERRAERRVAAARERFPWRTAVAALLAGSLAILCHAAPLDAARCGFACIGLVVAASGDARTGYLFDAVTLPTAAAVAVCAVLSDSTSAAALGTALVVLAFGGLVLLSHGRLMGFGDVKALVAIGAAFGPLEALVAIFAACVCGIVIAACRGRLRRGAELRFGAPLAFGATLTTVAGDPIAHRLLGA